jgi:hypothetical protein
VGEESRRYEKHCRRLLYLMEALQENGIACPSLKLIDHLLYGT